MLSTTNTYGMDDAVFIRRYNEYKNAVDALPQTTDAQVSRHTHAERLLKSASHNSSAFGYLDELLFADYNDNAKLDTSPMFVTDACHTDTINGTTRKRAYEHKHNYTDFGEYLYNVVINEKGKVLSYSFRKEYKNRYIIYYHDMQNSATSSKRRVHAPRVLSVEEFIALVFSFGALRSRRKKNRYGEYVYAEPCYQGNNVQVYRALLNYPIYIPHTRNNITL